MTNDFRKIKSLSLIEPITIPGRTGYFTLSYRIVKDDKYNHLFENDFKITDITYFNNGNALGTIPKGFGVTTSVGEVVIPLHNVSSITYESEE